MTSPEESSPCIVASSLAWNSLVRRSLDAWGFLYPDGPLLFKELLQHVTSLDEFLSNKPSYPMYWFFQQRDAFLSQKKLTKWSRDHLDDYVLLPAAHGYVRRDECFFVSHFWQKKDDPDPDGTYLRPIQEVLRVQTWSYIWVDWTCTPQAPHSQEEDIYFRRTLQTMSGIIRNCGFMWWYPPFEPRLWILYEVAEYKLTCREFLVTPDNKVFSDHIKEMLQVGVCPTLGRYGYRCTNQRDKEFLTRWLELLILLTRQHVEILDIRRLLDGLTWSPGVQEIYQPGLKLEQFKGILVVQGVQFSFTPFPEWVSQFGWHSDYLSIK